MPFLYAVWTRDQALVDRIIGTRGDDTGYLSVVKYGDGWIALCTPYTRRHVDWERFAGLYTIQRITLKTCEGS